MLQIQEINFKSPTKEFEKSLDVKTDPNPYFVDHCLAFLQPSVSEIINSLYLVKLSFIVSNKYLNSSSSMFEKRIYFC